MIGQYTQAVFLYCCLDYPSCLAYFSTISSAIWAAMKANSITSLCGISEVKYAHLRFTGHHTMVKTKLERRLAWEAKQKAAAAENNGMEATRENATEGETNNKDKESAGNSGTSVVEKAGTDMCTEKAPERDSGTLETSENQERENDTGTNVEETEMCVDTEKSVEMDSPKGSGAIVMQSDGQKDDLVKGLNQNSMESGQCEPRLNGKSLTEEQG